MKKHEVELTSEERQTLETLVSKGEHNALEIRHAHILLKADVKGPAWRDAEIAEVFGCHEQTVYNVRKRFRERGGLAALRRKKQSRPSRLPKLDGQGEARLIALCCSDPPKAFRVGRYNALLINLLNFRSSGAFLLKVSGKS